MTNTDGSKTVYGVRYSEGKLYNPDGKEYKGNNEYVSKVVKDIEQLKNDDEFFKNRLEILEKSDKYHVIEMPYIDPDFPDANTSNDSDPENNEDAINHRRTGSTIRYNPDSQKNRNEKRSPRVGLAHELISHSWDFDQGIEKQGTLSTADGPLDLNEVDAVNVENVVREKTGDKPKTSYGGVPIPPKLLIDPRKSKN